MKNKIVLILAALLLALASCTSNSVKAVTSETVPDPAMAYFYGTFAVIDGPNKIILELKNQDTGQKTSLYFLRGEDTLIVMPVIPGKYKLNQMVYRYKAMNELAGKKPFDGDDMTIEAGKAYYLGSWTGSTSKYRWVINNVRDNFEEDGGFLKSKFPSFSEMEQIDYFLVATNSFPK